jgi:hypothetical protein
MFLRNVGWLSTCRKLYYEDQTTHNHGFENLKSASNHNKLQSTIMGNNYFLLYSFLILFTLSSVISNNFVHVLLKWFWQWYVIYGTICFLDFIYRLFSHRTQHFGDWMCPRLQVERWRPTHLGRQKELLSIIIWRAQLSRSSSSHHLKTGTEPVSQTLCSVTKKTTDKVQKAKSPVNFVHVCPIWVPVRALAKGWTKRIFFRSKNGKTSIWILK